MFPIIISTTTDSHPELLRRQLGEVTLAAHVAIGKKWARDLLPEHYRPNARLVFGHRQRNAKYRRRKEALAKLGKVEDGGLIDGVFSGATRRSVLRAKDMVSATPKETSITIVGPSYFPARNRGKINLGDELKVVSDRHERSLTKEAEEAIERKLARLRGPKTTRTT